MKISRLFLLLLTGAFVLSLVTTAFAEKKEEKPAKKGKKKDEDEF